MGGFKRISGSVTGDHEGSFNLSSENENGVVGNLSGDFDPRGDKVEDPDLKCASATTSLKFLRYASNDDTNSIIGNPQVCHVPNHTNTVQIATRVQISAPRCNLPAIPRR